MGYVCPVEGIGVNNITWSDHTDVRPTILNLVGLKDDYVHDGRVVTEILKDYAVPNAARRSRGFDVVAAVNKQLNAPFGAFAIATSTKASASYDPNDATYNSIENQIQTLAAKRDALAAEMIGVLNGAEFDGQEFSGGQAFWLVIKGLILQFQANALPH